MRSKAPALSSKSAHRIGRIDLMDLTLSSDEEELLAAIVDCVEGELPVSRLHGDETARRAGELQRLATLGSLGWFRISLPEADGGAGLGLVEEALLFREFGRRLAPIATFTAAIGARVAAAVGKADLLDEIACGTRQVAFAVPQAPISWESGAPSGPLRIFATAPSDIALLLLPDAAFLLDIGDAQAPPKPCLDRTLVMTSANLFDASVLARAEGDEYWSRALVLLAATMTGQAEATRDMINDYAKIRTTFGRPIGANQAVRHPIAEMAARCEQSKSMLFYAALALQMERRDGGTLAAAARVLAQSTAARNDDSNIQLHGGIGVTDELSAHHYLKRTAVYATWLGGVKAQLPVVLAAPLLEV